MIRKSLGTLKEAIARHAEELGTSFTARTDEEHATASGKEASPAESREGAELVRLLKRYFIRKLTIAPEASLEELFQVCYLLREDQAGGEDGAEKARVSFEEWKHIRVEFFEADDLAEGTVPDVAVLEAAAAPHLAGGVQTWLEGLPAEVQGAATKAFKKPELLAEVLQLRKTIQKDSPSLEVTFEGEKVDLLKEILRLSGPRPCSAAEVDPAIQSVISTLRSVTRFLSDNQSYLNEPSNAASSHRDLDALLKGFKEPSSANPSLKVDAGRVQGQKEKLGFLFQLIRGGAALPSAGPPSAGPGAPAPPTAQAAGAAAPPARREEEKVDIQSLQSQLDKIGYDLTSFQRACRSVDSERRYLRVLQELLATDGPRQEIQGKWSAVVKSISSSLEGCGSPEEAIQLIVESFKGNEVPEVYDIVGELLAARGAPAEISRAVQKAVLPQGGPAAAKQVLACIVAADETKGIQVLATLAREGVIALRQVAISLLATCCTHLESVVEWAKADPSCLGKPEVRKLLGESEPRKVYDAFSKLFKQSSSQESTGVLREVPAGATELEPVILAAIERGPPPVRKLGLLQVPRLRMAAGFKLLTDIIVENNQRERPRMSDVEAALQALAEMKDPRAEGFLRQVGHERRWLRHVWRREIRDALQSLYRGSGGIHAARR